MTITILYKGDGWAGKRSSSKSFSAPRRISREEELHNKIQKGTVLDSDIKEIKKDPSLLKELDRKANENYSRLRKSTVYNDFGKGSFDGIDNDGNFYKNIDLDPLEK